MLDCRAASSQSMHWSHIREERKRERERGRERARQRERELVHVHEHGLNGSVSILESPKSPKPHFVCSMSQ